MIVSGIHHVSINVSDVDRALAFYVDVLGLDTLPRPDFAFGGAWLATPDGREIHLLVAAVPPDVGQHVAFEVDDIDAAVATVRAHGGELVGDVENYEDLYRLCYVRGPERIIVELAQRIG